MTKDYDVGYGKPPKHTQFQKGQSGNKTGRTKGTKNFKTDFMEEMNSTIILNEGGKTIKLTKQRAIIKRMVNSAITDTKYSEPVLKLSIQFSNADTAPENSTLSAEELKLLKMYIEEKENE